MITAKHYSYNSFLESITRDKWQRIGINRRAGVCAPLFSIYSNSSLGIGEISDLKLLIDWAKQTGLTIIQLLPINDTGFSFTPYDSQSSFALDPIYLHIENLVEINPDDEIKNKIDRVKQDPKFKQQNVNYEIKKIKLDILWEIFLKADRENPRFDAFIKANNFWIHDYALYKALKDKHEQRSWTEWTAEISADPLLVSFYTWLQWQLYEQFKAVKEYAQSLGILLLGDLPLFVSYDSADVWSHKECFKLDSVSGAPPDAYSETGQRWGMPVYNWEEMAKRNYDYYINKLKYAQNFYDLFRIDHAIGLFRVWTIANDEPFENAGLNGVFDPENEEIWEEHGKVLYHMILDNSSMLPCAEDLGIVPDCSPKVLEEFAIPGIEVQRWLKTSKGDEFLASEEYRKNSMAVISTHDMSHFALWWVEEATEEGKKLFIRYCRNADDTREQAAIQIKEAVKLALEKISDSASIFSIQLIHDWLSLGDFQILQKKESRINLPGTVALTNWSFRLPISLEQLNQLEINDLIREINYNSQRVS